MICNSMDRYKTGQLFNMYTVACKTERIEFERDAML